MAIHSSSNKMMTLSQIYKFITDNFPFYWKNGTRWQNSLRHNLSFNDCFVKVSKSGEHGGKGNYWTLHSKCSEMFLDGSFLRRKRRFQAEDTDDSKSQDERVVRDFQSRSFDYRPSWRDYRGYHPSYPLQQNEQNAVELTTTNQSTASSSYSPTKLKSFKIVDI